jgi:hypothetical protein
LISQQITNPSTAVVQLLVMIREIYSNPLFLLESTQDLSILRLDVQSAMPQLLEIIGDEIILSNDQQLE